MLAGILLGFLIGAACAGALLTSTRIPKGARHATVLISEAVLLLIAAAGLTGFGMADTALQALLAAVALGLQHGLTSSFRGMSVRTTHFTGTVTDLGLLLGRSGRHGIDKWKVAILSLPLLLFLTGAVAGILVGARLGGHALLVPASICVAVAVADAVQSYESIPMVATVIRRSA